LSYMEPSICHISIFTKLDGDFRVPFYSRHWVYHNSLRHCFVPLTVKDSDWSQTASTKAPRSEQRKFPVFRGFPWFDPICALNGFQNLRRALDIASSSKANNANVLTLRLEGEEVVEGHDPHQAGFTPQFRRGKPSGSVVKSFNECKGTPLG